MTESEHAPGLNFDDEETDHQLEYTIRRPRQRPRVRFLSLVYLAGKLPDEVRFWPISGERVTIGRDSNATDVHCPDREVSRVHAAMIYNAEEDAYRLRDLGSANGTYASGARTEGGLLKHGVVVSVGGSLFVYTELDYGVRPEVAMPRPGRSAGLASVLAMADAFALADGPVLLRGPFGTPKDAVAERIHNQSLRMGELVTVNCGTTSQDRMAQTLFGSAEGPGAFQRAAGGTIFLDGIDELDPDVQSELQRVLETRTVRPVGTELEVPVDFRLVAAAHQNLERRVELGSFRSGLLASVEGLEITVPALCDRRDEILSTLARHLDESPPKLSLPAAEALLSYAWPRNGRELELLAKRIRALLDVGETIDIDALPPKLVASVHKANKQLPSRNSLEIMLEKTDGNISRLAESLGWQAAQVDRLCQQYGLSPSRFKRAI